MDPASRRQPRSHGCEPPPAAAPDARPCRRRPRPRPGARRRRARRAGGAAASTAAAVDCRVAGGDQVVEHDRGSREEPPRQVDVEVAHVADDDHVGRRQAPRLPPQLSPGGDELQQEQREAPGLPERLHARRRRDAERDVALAHVVPERVEAVHQDAHRLVTAGVVGAEEEDAAGRARGRRRANRGLGDGTNERPGRRHRHPQRNRQRWHLNLRRSSPVAGAESAAAQVAPAVAHRRERLAPPARRAAPARAWAASRTSRRRHVPNGPSGACRSRDDDRVAQCRSRASWASSRRRTTAETLCRTRLAGTT